MTTLIVGGSSGLGLAMAKEFADGGDKVVITGRQDPKVKFAEFRQLDLSKSPIKTIEALVKELPNVDRLVFSAGFYQEGRVTDLSDAQISEMVNVSGLSLVYLMRELLKKQGKLAGLVTITSTSQWTPRKLEPIYNFVKAGIGQFSNSMVEDGRVNKVLVVGPSGMRTAFWDGVKRDDLDAMLDKEWVAQLVLKELDGNYKYKFIKILRQPARVEVAEIR